MYPSDCTGSGNSDHRGQHQNIRYGRRAHAVVAGPEEISGRGLVSPAFASDGFTAHLTTLDA